ncbi:MAG: transglutaminase family protein [Saonia sp.]
MSLEYSITYKAENNYENEVHEAHWQFLIIPEPNATQEFITIDFENSMHVPNEFSVNGYGFQTIRVHPKQRFNHISFEAHFKLLKKEVNPFDFDIDSDIDQSYKQLEKLDFKVDFEPFLRHTRFTTLPEKNKNIFVFDKHKSIFNNLMDLNQWTYEHIHFKTGVTDVHTTLDEVIVKRKGVCQDFSHLFSALARQNEVPARYVSGYLHQGNGYFGDSQMHAWVEAYVPFIGWIGFDATNNLLANTNHIKVAHGKDYNDCSPLRGVVRSQGANETRHSVQVSGQEQQ